MPAAVRVRDPRYFPVAVESYRVEEVTLYDGYVKGPNDFGFQIAVGDPPSEGSYPELSSRRIRPVNGKKSCPSCQYWKNLVQRGPAELLKTVV